MKAINLKCSLSITFLCLSLLTACTHDQAKSKQEDVKSNAQATQAAQSSYGTVNTWLDDFKNFRTAVYKGDTEKMKTYFNFPVNADTTQIWEAVYEQADESKRPPNSPGTFTEADFDKHYKEVFNTAFLKSLLKVKSEELFKKGAYTTPAIKEKGGSFSMAANYDKATATLQLSVMYSGGTDENGEEIGEGESATIYFFKVENHKYLKFDKILFAG